jgi:sigma-E factor negative regulatory protein RseB
VPVTNAQASQLHRSGWRLPATLGDSLELFDSRLHGGVLHLSYTDGLFAVSVFTQQGRLNSASVKGWERVTMAGGPAWTRPGLSQRVVWAGRGWVYTAVADAPDSAVAAAVAAFPVRAGESFPHRVVRGLHRMGSWVDPRR